MDRKNITEKTIELVSLIFKEDKAALNLETELSHIKNFDSLEQLNLFLKIEQEFKTNFDMQELVRMKKIKDIVDGIAVRKL
ncbi:MAG: acyl carrier protein [Candidatus Omnitrophica bacterium]|nr:acyl carrier protein [Candidatus Omnitrophota bacterium]